IALYRSSPPAARASPAAPRMPAASTSVPFRNARRSKGIERGVHLIAVQLPRPMSSRSRAAALIAAYAIAFGAPASAQADRVASAETIALARLSEWFGPSDAVRPPVVAAPIFAPAGDMEVERLAVRAAAAEYWRRVVAPAPAWFLDDLADYSADRVVPELFSALA